jgi:hypothetical protein
LVKRDLHRKEESRRHEQKRVKEHLKKKFRDKPSQASYGTTSADGHHFPHTSADRSNGGSAPAPSGGKGGGMGMVLLDPLDSAYVARNGQEKVEKAIHWDWNDGNDDYTSPTAAAASPSVPTPAPTSASAPPGTSDLPLRKGDLNDPYLDGLQDCSGAGEDYNFSDNYLKNTHESSPFTPYLSSPALVPPPAPPSAPSTLAPPSLLVFPPIDSTSSSSSTKKNTSLTSSEIKPSLPLSVSFAQMISSHSRPHLSTGKSGGITTIPSAVEKVLKRRKKTEHKSKEDKK